MAKSDESYKFIGPRNWVTKQKKRKESCISNKKFLNDNKNKSKQMGSN